MNRPEEVATLASLTLVLSVSVLMASGQEAATTNRVARAPQASPAGELRVMGLEECLTSAMHNSHRRPASKFAVAVAEAQHRQALAGYWPQVTARGGYQRVDEAPDILVPASHINVPASSAVVTVPAGVLGPSAVQLPVSTPAQSIAVPAQDIKLLDPDNFCASVNATWLLYDGGMRKGYGEQTQGLVEMMKQEARRTDLEIVDSVKRYYYGSVLARQLRRVGQDTLARMEATLTLTESLYKEGSGKVKKTDFLDNKVMVETLRAMVAQLEKNEHMAQAALANTMGLSWTVSIQPTAQELPYAPVAEHLDKLVGSAYRFSPDWAKVEAAIRAAEGGVRTANSGYYPKVALTGDLHQWWNEYDAGIATDRNKQGWTVGVGVEIPIFNGFLTRNKVAEAKARVAKVQEEQFLLKEGLGLQIKDVFLGLDAAQKSYQATLEAMKAAVEDRELTGRAYQNELVETEKVLRTQLLEALMTAQHYKTCYDHLALQSQLNLLVGTEILKQLQGHS